MAGSLPWPAEPLTTRANRALVVVGLVLLLALIATGTWAVVRPGAPAPPARGSINVVVALATGGATLRDCGAAARATCAAELGRTDPFARLVQPQCRLAGVEP